MQKHRPKVIPSERERLYDDVMKKQIVANSLKRENTCLKTKIQILTTELARNEKLTYKLLME